MKSNLDKRFAFLRNWLLQRILTYLFITHPNIIHWIPPKIAIVDLGKMIHFLPSSCKECYLTILLMLLPILALAASDNWFSGPRGSLNTFTIWQRERERGREREVKMYMNRCMYIQTLTKMYSYSMHVHVYYIGCGMIVHVCRMFVWQ